MKGATNSIPARELHWKKYSYLRNEEHKIYFMCECGKKYVSFAAYFCISKGNTARKSKICTTQANSRLFALSLKKCTFSI